MSAELSRTIEPFGQDGRPERKIEKSLKSKINTHTWVYLVKPEKRLITGKTYIVIKKIFDSLVVFLTAPLWLSILCLCTLAIKLESPHQTVLFSQTRTGEGGRRFRMFKLRTMVPHAEELKKKLAHNNALKWPDFKIPNDPRITRVGLFLRKTSLDELPQVLNVLKGEMSLVGPRPTSFSSDTYSLWQTERLEVKPGLTGLWQIGGRSSTEFNERIRLDIAYIEQRCLWLDIIILFRTIFVVIEAQGK